MKSSFYNFYFDSNGKKYVYNILSTAIIQLEEVTYFYLKNNLIHNISKDYLKDLINMKFIVNKNANESDEYKYYYDSTRFGGTASDFRLMLIPTYNCNLRCPYCYEGQKKEIEKITKENVNKIILFIKKQLIESEYKIDKMVISLFGGEPTLCYDTIELFLRETTKLSNEFNIDVFYDMTTNFTLINENILTLIKTYQISTQITIDGNKIQHDLRRITQSGKGTYDCILDNLKSAFIHGLKDLITVRINVDEENINESKEVFNEMLNYSNDVYFGILNKYSGINDEFSKKCIESNRVTQVFVDKLLKLYYENNLEIPIKFGKKNPCSLNSINKYMVDYKLNVYKCDLLLNKDEYKVGIIDDNGELVINNNYYSQLGYSPFLFDECQKCKFLPLCASNCPAERILKEKTKRGLPRGYCAFDEDKLLAYLKSYVKMME